MSTTFKPKPFEEIELHVAKLIAPADRGSTEASHLAPYVLAVAANLIRLNFYTSKTILAHAVSAALQNSASPTIRQLDPHSVINACFS